MDAIFPFPKGAQSESRHKHKFRLCTATTTAVPCTYVTTKSGVFRLKGGREALLSITCYQADWKKDRLQMYASRYMLSICQPVSVKEV